MNDINVRLKQLRQNKELSQRQVAEYLGIPQQTYSNYERDMREIPAIHVINLAELYCISTDSLLGINHTNSDSIDLNAAFIQNISFQSLLHYLTKLDNHNRQELLRFLIYLTRKDCRNG